jgi:CheY-like chemotaxis protein
VKRSSAAGSGPTILVADDEPSLRLLCKINLEADGYRVLEAESEADLDRVLAEDDVTAVLLDIGLGSDDGVAIARRLRRERPDLPLAFFTGSALPLGQAERSLVDDVIWKPFSLAQLSETARRLAPA